MRDIVNIKFIRNHQEEILKIRDIIPYTIIKYIDYQKIEKYYNKHKKEKIFKEEFQTIEEWIYSEKDVLNDYDFFHNENYRKFFKKNNSPQEYKQKFEEYIEILELWIECYPQFKEILIKENFKEYIENDGTLSQTQELNEIEKKFHELIMQRAGKIIEELQIPLPHITIELLEKDDFKREPFSVPGMYGGFYYYLDVNENYEFFLNVDSWSRICGGSGQTHIITANKCELVDEGYV